MPPSRQSSAAEASPDPLLGPEVPDSNVPLAGDSPQSEILRAVTDRLKSCYDPEIPVDIYELGLIYRIDVDEHGIVDIQMTLTSPNCPAAQSLPMDVRFKAESADGVKAANVEVVWYPPWEPGRMSEAAKLELGFD